VVSDVRIRPGQHLGVGELILTLVGADARMSMVALLPGRYRPMLRPGLPIRFELSGYRYEYRQLTIDSVGDEIIGPAEAKRYLGPGVADGVAVDGPVVLVRASMPSTGFVSEGQAYRYFDGLPARAEARVRSEPIVVTLMPALKVLFHHEH
jgi:membrane fusion protein (multidrug efflux system)